MKDKLEFTPKWVFNLMTIGSAIVTFYQVISQLYTYFSSYIRSLMGESTGAISVNIRSRNTCIAMSFLIIMLILQVRKYRSLSVNKMKVTSESFSKAAGETRNLYFEILSKHKDGNLTLKGLKGEYDKTLQIILNELCSVMKAFTGQEVSACIKLIKPSENGENINLYHAEIITFCRSSHSDSGRNEYELNSSSLSQPIYIRDNSDFLDILDNTNDRNYFYQQNLITYEKNQKVAGKEYLNTNKNWRKYYRAALVVPIRILNEKIGSYDVKDAYNVIGFMCIDSMSTVAFKPIQENFNVNIARSFADNVYILLSQYSHYLSKYSIEMKK